MNTGRDKKQTRRRLLLIGLPVAVLLIGVGIATWLVLSKPAPEKQASASQAIMVETVEVHKAVHELVLNTQGTVRAVNEMIVLPQVSGKIVEINPDLVAGGRVQEGELLYRIDPEDYQVELQRSEAALAEAQAQLALERGRREVAKKEWELLGESLDQDQKAPALALREPQLRQAEAAVSSAEAAVARAQLQLDRTRVTAPFDAAVASEDVALGQTVGPQAQTARLVGMDLLHVQTAVPTQFLPLLEFGANGSRAEVIFDPGQASASYWGRVVKLLPQLARQSRMAQVLVELENPFEQHMREGGISKADTPADSGANSPANHEANRLPLLIDSFVEVNIRAAENVAAVELPREYLRPGDRVWVMANGKLDIREVEVLWEEAESVLIETGLQDGEQVVTTAIANPVEGIELTTETSDRSADGDKEADRDR
ncbi:efflux RND transporter periplasmic adaptor subunit [Proteobacteria bacterium 005FR1]|nr:efflux RND transporter periplasmic adaptor subunit [Proteobacteria bacterium 005FR1]